MRKEGGRLIRQTHRCCTVYLPYQDESFFNFVGGVVDQKENEQDRWIIEEERTFLVIFCLDR